MVTMVTTQQWYSLSENVSLVFVPLSNLIEGNMGCNMSNERCGLKE